MPVATYDTPSFYCCIQLHGLCVRQIPTDSATGQTFRWFMQWLESVRVLDSQGWAGQTWKFRRCPNSEWASRISEAAQWWITEHMGDVQ